MAEMADRVCPSIQISIDKKEPTIPTAASDSVLSEGILPTTAASVLDSIGSAIPAIIAGMANCCMRLKEMSMLANIQIFELQIYGLHC